VLAHSGSRVFAVALLLVIGAANSARSAEIPESGVVAFERGGDIFVANVDGSGERNLTRVGVGFATYPDASPDGSMIAFDEQLGNGFDQRVAVVSMDGSGLRRVGSVTRTGRPHWSPDGRLIAYGGPRLEVVAPDGTGLLTVATDADEFGFAWSPDGREIAYGSDSDLRAVDVATGAIRNVVATSGASNLAWSPDGSKIAFMRFADEVWLVDRDGSGLHRLVQAELVGAPKWSPESDRIAVSIDENYPEEPSRILLVDVVTGTSHGLTSPEFGEGSDSPSWSPDGSRIAYERDRFRGNRSDHDIWVVDRDGTGKLEVTYAFPLGTSASQAEWVPRLARIEPDVEIGPTVSVLPRHVLKMTTSAETLATDKTHAAFAGTEFGVWSVQTGRLRRIPGRCEILRDLAIAGTRLAWVCREEGASFVHEWLQTATLARSRPVDVVHVNYSGLAVAGSGSLMIFSTGRKIWRLDGRQKHLVRIERTVVWPRSVDAGRALLELKDGSLAAIGANGRLIRRFRFAQRPLAAELTGENLVVVGAMQGAPRLQLYRLSDSKRVRSWPTTGDTPDLQSARGRFAVYVVGIAIHLIDLLTGDVVILRFPQQAGTTNARLVPAGLVYSYGEAYSERPGRLGIIPMAALVKSFR
jgi:Tol biopolymer transport system component